MGYDNWFHIKYLKLWLPYSTKCSRAKTFVVRLLCKYSWKNSCVCIKTMSTNAKTLWNLWKTFMVQVKTVKTENHKSFGPQTFCTIRSCIIHFHCGNHTSIHYTHLTGHFIMWILKAVTNHIAYHNMWYIWRFSESRKYRQNKCTPLRL